MFLDQGVMTDENEKLQQTAKRYRQGPNRDFVPSPLQKKGVSPRQQRAIDSGSEYDSETETETETETQSETEPEPPSSMVVMDAQKPIAPRLQKERTPRTPRTPKSDREYESRQKSYNIIREKSGYVEVEHGKSSDSEDGAVTPPHPSASFEKPRKKKKSMAIIEVQEAVELDARRNEESMEEERQVAVPAGTRESMRQIDEGQVSLDKVTEI